MSRSGTTVRSKPKPAPSWLYACNVASSVRRVSSAIAAKMEVPRRFIARPGSHPPASQSRRWNATSLACRSKMSASLEVKNRPRPVWRFGWLVSLPLLSSSIASVGSSSAKASWILSNTPRPSSDTSSCTWLGVWRSDTVTLVPSARPAMFDGDSVTV